MFRSPEYFQQRAEKRKELKEFLPIDKRLEGKFTKTKWTFPESLYSIRNSESLSDRFFIEKLRVYNSEPHSEMIVELTEQREQEIQELLTNLQGEMYFLEGWKDTDSDVRWGTAQSLSALAQVNPELFQTLLEQGLKDTDFGVRRGTTQSLLKYPFATESQLSAKVNAILTQKTTSVTKLFTQKLLTKNIQVNTPEKVWEYQEVLTKVVDYVTSKNETLDTTKQVASVEHWFTENQLQLASLAEMFTAKDFGIFLTELTSNGILYAESFLKIISPVLNNSEIRRACATYLEKSQLTYSQTNKLFETIALLIKSQQISTIKETLQTSSNPLKDLETELLHYTAKSVGLGSKALPAGLLDRWNAEFLANLGSNNAIIEQRIQAGENNYENVQMLYKKIVERGFVGDFKQFILDVNSGDEVGAELAHHN